MLKITMEAIYIPWLAKAPEQTEVIQIQEFVPGLETLMPVRGRLKVTHQGNYLEVFVQAEAIVTLTCHRCLQQYNHRLSIDTSELIWLEAAENQQDAGPLERETPLEDLVETLPTQGFFQPDVWLYEQMCLALPLRQLCDNKCPGIPANDTTGAEVLSDRRWVGLEAIKRQLPS
ncbi:MAG: DUF177 domain-containing protein [Chamaesiphon sp.]